MEYFKEHQLNLMLILGGICAIITFFTYITKTLGNKRKAILMSMEISAMMLLFSDRYAYIYRGSTETGAYWMVRISNFLVFFLTVVILHTFSMYFTDLLVNDAGLSKVPIRLKAVGVIAVTGELLVVVSQFTGLYYTIDESNVYHRSSLYFISYVIPVLIHMLVMSVVIPNYKRINKGIRLSLLLFTILPLFASVLQFFVYGISFTNIAMSLTVILLYVFALVDMNETMERVNKLEIELLDEERKSLKSLFGQTAMAFVTAIDAKDLFTRGHSQRVADIARKIAERAGKDEQECEKAYYAALLHDVGKLGIPDSIFLNDGSLTEEEIEQVRQKPIIGNQILSGINEYPYLSDGAHYCSERFDGKGYPEGLKGDDIPEVARIIAVADAYDNMTSHKSYRDPMPRPEVREELMKCSGTQFDPEFVKIMIDLMDGDEEFRTMENNTVTASAFAQEIHCTAYRSNVLPGIRVVPETTVIRFTAERDPDASDAFSAPSVIVFDSYDGREHNNYKAIKAYHYLEYGEVWFDGHSISTNARNMQVNVVDAQSGNTGKAGTDGTGSQKDNIISETGTSGVHEYMIETGRYRDHMIMRMTGGGKTIETIIALPDSSKSAYIGITGENCFIGDIKIDQTGRTLGEDDIPRIADEISYIDRMTGDVPNIQIEGTRTAVSKGFAVSNGMSLTFHAMSLPSSSLVWHCPYIVLYSSDNGEPDGDNYREYALVKLNGEIGEDGDHPANNLEVTKGSGFAGWDVWKKKCKEGFECEIRFSKLGRRIIMTTDNMGISVRNTTVVNDRHKTIYAAVTGDHCAISDIWAGYTDITDLMKFSS